ncbi:GAP family protein [Mycolicibacterium litorale]|uniref:Membrane protein n=1 Tax=Mycolicibacterium litorale TaxID=758802 RepID=A0AAD1MT84_9MYCO|nr:GAP family protein [Mycolicibacterium litorale]MCV7416863.1 GAP family protein [Mycolicibacterium litorale]TDY04648.1 Sap-like sulfolipid-1-addressing protein [Mycolicibacterium litorale]BBY18074.1 membrane protein [Mycolicibacterium litorale]
MSGSWGSVLTELIPLALVITLSPLSVIPAVLMLQTPRPRPTALAFMAGWLLGLGVLTAVFVAVSGAIGGFEKPPSWASWLRIVIGAALVVFGVVRFARRRSASHQPKWLRNLTTLGPAKAAATAAALTVANPKVLFLCVAAGLAIGSAGLGGAVWAAVVYFAAVAGSSVAVPILAYAMSGDRLDAALERLKDWMERNHATLMAVILVVIGLLVLYKGIHAL